jgi:hypothetical protein
MAPTAKVSALPNPDPSAAPSVRDAARVVGWGLVFWGGALVAANLVARNATAAVAIQAALAEWGAGRMTIAWSDPMAPLPTWRQIGARAGRGAALGAVLSVAVVAIAVVTHAATFASRTFSAGLLGVGLVVALLGAVRDELLLRGVALRATRGLLPWWASLIVCGAVAAGARWGLGEAIGLGLVAEALRGVALAALWTRDRGAWMPIAANAAWTWVFGAVVRGGLVDVRAASEVDTGVAATIVLAIAAVAAAAWVDRGARAGRSRVGEAR